MNQNERIGELVAWLAERGCWPQLANQDSDGPRGWMVCRTVGVCGSDQASGIFPCLLDALEAAHAELTHISPDLDARYRAAARVYAGGWLVKRTVDPDQQREWARQALAAGEDDQANRHSVAATVQEAAGGAGEIVRRLSDEHGYQRVFEPVSIHEVPAEMRDAVAFLVERGFAIEAPYEDEEG